jgi:hypothetical protein
MRRLPVLPTIVVAGAVAVMIALGVWQLQRAAWKERLLAEYAGAAALPVVDLDPLLDGDGAPDIRAGRSATDVSGQVYVVPCRPGAAGLAGRIRVNAGWANRPDAVQRLSLSGIVAGHLGPVEGDGPVTLTAATASPPLARSQPTSIENIPNNHMLYALQWFFFAAAAAVIYVMALRKRNAPTLPPEP